MKTRLYDEYIRYLVAANDETVSEKEHHDRVLMLRGWLQGVEDASGHTFNGDYYYIHKIDKGEMAERPTCCGQFLDWRSKEEKK